MVEIDTEKEIYLFLHGRMDLKEKAMSALISKGFTNEKVIMAITNKGWKCGRLHGNVVDATKSRSHKNSANY